MSILTRRFLTIPTTSTTIEFTFSINNNIIIKCRNKLNFETIKQLILLKSWKIKDIKDLEKLLYEEED